MRIVVITSSQPFYLSESFRYLLSLIPESLEVVGCVVVRGQVGKKKKSAFDRAKEVIDIFGLRFFVYYSYQLFKIKAGLVEKLEEVFREFDVPYVRLTDAVNSEGSIKKIKSMRPDLIVSISGGEIFRQPILTLAPKGCINLHTSLLPKYRGLMPTFWVLKNRERRTGVSVFHMTEGIDDGPIIVQKEIEIPEDMTQEELIRRSKRIGMEAIVEALLKIEEGDITTIMNDDNEATYFSFPTKRDVKQFRSVGSKFF